MVNVLLVDDDDATRELVSRSLKRAETEFSVTCAEDGREALNILRGQVPDKPIQNPALILLDLNMPGMNGLEFLRELRIDAQLKNAPVFVLTSSDAKSDKENAHSHCIAGYMVKSDVGTRYQKMTAMLESYVNAVSY